MGKKRRWMNTPPKDRGLSAVLTGGRVAVWLGPVGLPSPDWRHQVTCSYFDTSDINVVFRLDMLFRRFLPHRIMNPASQVKGLTGI